MASFYASDKARVNRPESMMCDRGDCEFYDPCLGNNCQALDIVVLKCNFYKEKDMYD